MFNCNVINKPNININQLYIDKILQNIDNKINKTQNGILNIVFLDEYSIKNLNKEYRKIDKTTDVLSFHYFDDFSEIEVDEIAGEIIMSENKIIEQGKEYGLGVENEFYKLLIHSILHILGYDHEDDNDFKIMEDLENIIYGDLHLINEKK